MYIQIFLKRFEGEAKTMETKILKKIRGEEERMGFRMFSPFSFAPPI